MSFERGKSLLLWLVQGVIDSLTHLTSLLVEITHPTPTTYRIHKSQGTVTKMLSLPSQRPLDEGQACPAAGHGGCS